MACALVACSPPAKVPEICASPHAIPDPDWAIGTPAEHGLDADALQSAADYAGSNGSRCLLVVRHSKLVGEWYWQGDTKETAPNTWSLAKSYTSTLVGLAIEEGLIHSIDDPVSNYVPEWKGLGRDGIKLRHLLTMTSGLKFDQDSDSFSFLTAHDMTGQAIALDVDDAPGEVWKYSNQAVQILEAVLRHATGKPVDVYAREKLWSPMGVSAEWHKDGVGHPSTYMNVLTTCRNHARFGELFLRQGCWGSKRVVPSAWVGKATKPSQALNKGYGLLWWLNAGAPTLDSVYFDPLESGSFHPFAPADSFCASGLGGQMIEVIPSLDMVVVRVGYAPQEDPALQMNGPGTLAATLNDGKQIVHNGVLQRVLSAVR